MQTAAPTLQDWSRLKQAAAVIMTGAAPVHGRMLLKAVKELHAFAVTLLFALARWILKSLPAPRPKSPIIAAPAPFRRTPRTPFEGWRNPSAQDVALLGEGPHALSGLPPTPGPRRLDAQRAFEKGVALLKAIQALCADPEKFARRLARRLQASALGLARDEVKAFAKDRYAQFRRNRAAARFLRRPLRRRDSS